MFNKSRSNGDTPKNIKNTLKGIALSVGILSAPIAQAAEKVQAQVVQTIDVQENEKNSYLNQKVGENHIISKRLLLDKEGTPYMKDIEKIGVYVEGNIIYPKGGEIVFRTRGNLLEALFEGKIIATVILNRNQENIVQLPKKATVSEDGTAVENMGTDKKIEQTTPVVDSMVSYKGTNKLLSSTTKPHVDESKNDEKESLMKAVFGVGGVIGLLGWISRRKKKKRKKSYVYFENKTNTAPPEFLSKIEDNNRRLASLKDTIEKHFSDAPSGKCALREVNELFRKNNNILLSSEEEFLLSCKEIDSGRVRLQNYCRDLSRQKGDMKRSEKIAEHFYNMLFKDDLFAVNQNIKNMYLL